MDCEVLVNANRSSAADATAASIITYHIKRSIGGIHCCPALYNESHVSHSHTSLADKLTRYRRGAALPVLAVAGVVLLGAKIPSHALTQLSTRAADATHMETVYHPRALVPFTGSHLMRTQAPACTTPKYRQFDFFAGDWDTYDFADSTKIIARNRVTPMLGGCAVREVYEQYDGVRGESFSMYDATRGIWHQSWVTNGGTLLLLNGGLHDGHMILTATVPSGNGTSSLLRGVWTPLKGSVRETAERSVDHGKTWTLVFDIVFRPHKQPHGT